VLRVLVSQARGHLAGAGVIDIGVDKRLISMGSGAFPSLLSRRSGKKKLEEVSSSEVLPWGEMRTLWQGH